MHASSYEASSHGALYVPAGLFVVLGCITEAWQSSDVGKLTDEE